MISSFGSRAIRLAATVRAYSDSIPVGRRTWVFSPDVLLPGIMALVTLTLGIFLVPRLDWPISDETFYAGPAFRFAQTGQLLLEPEVQPSLVTQAAWGALFL